MLPKLVRDRALLRRWPLCGAITLATLYAMLWIVLAYYFVVKYEGMSLLLMLANGPAGFIVGFLVFFLQFVFYPIYPEFWPASTLGWIIFAVLLPIGLVQYAALGYLIGHLVEKLSHWWRQAFGNKAS